MEGALETGSTEPVGGPDESETGSAREEHRTLTKVLGEDNPEAFWEAVRRRAGNKGIWLRGLTQ